MEDERIVAGLHCGEVLADLTEHLDGRLSLDRARADRRAPRRMRGCGRLRGEVAAVVRALRQLPDEPLPPGVEERLAEALLG